MTEALPFRSQHRRAAEDRVLRPQHRAAGRHEHCGAPVHLRPAQVPHCPETLLPPQTCGPLCIAARPCRHQTQPAVVHTTTDCTARPVQFSWRLRGLNAVAATRARRAPPTPPASSSARRCRTTRGTPSGATTQQPSCPQASRRPRQAPLTFPTSLNLPHNSNDPSSLHSPDGKLDQSFFSRPACCPAHALFRLSKPEG